MADAIQHRIVLRYDGKRFVTGQMDAYEAAGGLIGFSDFAKIVAAETYGTECKISSKIEGYTPGSGILGIIVDIVQGGHIGTIANA